MPLLTERSERVDRAAAQILDDVYRHAVPLRSYFTTSSGLHLERIVRLIFRLF